jgi:lipopolysaccharide transport system ATP-binding protein
MSDIAIRCEGLSKQYRIGQQERYRALRDVIADAAASPIRRLRATFNGHNSNGTDHSSNGSKPLQENLIWALDDVSFEVKRGELVGIIGRNGAGKSTLLKILSRITKPTNGHAEINGRVGSLLEVGTGFHPELTGRENVYLNGAILGMRKAEIDRKFDEIVGFAELEKFIDTTVKRYSSGMYVRLAFAVAAHMETEVLLVDEVLAVGDMEFQRKCLGKIGTVGKEGRTVLFVSHNMVAIQNICRRSLLLNKAKIQFDGHSEKVIQTYTESAASESRAATEDLKHHQNRQPACQPIFSRMKIMDHHGATTTTFAPGDDVIFEFELTPSNPITQPTLGVGIDNALGVRVFSVATYFSNAQWKLLDRPTIVRCRIPNISLLPGRYALSLSVGSVYNYLMDAIPYAAFFTVEPNNFFGNGRLPTLDLGVVLSKSSWEFSETP